MRALRGGEDLAIEAGVGGRVTLVAVSDGTVVGTDGLRWPLATRCRRPRPFSREGEDRTATIVVPIRR
ncbi:MAG TPA: hypothetical protein VFC31_06285 [Candidatus Limnocylindria bacterium]|nr:hypothetical protein [Candidatus Limnocylindria bacterium]